MEKIIREMKLARGILFKNDQVLLVQDIRPQQGHFFLPGGNVEPGESVQVALVREWNEELGWNIQVDSFIGCLEHSWTFNRSTDSTTVHVFEVNFLFTVKCPSELIARQPLSKEPHLKFAWVGIDQLSSIQLLPSSLKRILPEILNKNTSGVWESTI